MRSSTPGFGGALLFTADGDVQLPNGTLPDVPAVVNFGIGGAESAFKRLAAFRPGAPMMTGEYWAGWFDHWGRQHSTHESRRARRASSAWMLERGYSINLYMFHGGTTRGFMNGANIDNSRYFPQTSSYDYDAALNESGRLTPKYTAFRDLIARAHEATPPPIPATRRRSPSRPSRSRARRRSGRRCRRGVRVERPRPMETFGQAYGYILYRTTRRRTRHGRAERSATSATTRRSTSTARSRARSIDGSNRTRITIDVPAAARELDILVENLGRVNFNKPLRDERKGITRAGARSASAS